MAPVIAAAGVISEFGPILWGQPRLVVKRIATLELTGSLDLIARQMLCRPQRRPYYP